MSALTSCDNQAWIPSTLPWQPLLELIQSGPGPRLHPKPITAVLFTANVVSCEICPLGSNKQNMSNQAIWIIIRCNKGHVLIMSNSRKSRHDCTTVGTELLYRSRSLDRASVTTRWWIIDRRKTFKVHQVWKDEEKCRKEQQLPFKTKA